MINSEELDKHLCEKYPRIFRDRNAPMHQTCMFWGFETGPGWGNILKALCGNIQHHINWKRQQRARAIRYNRCLKRALAGDTLGLTWLYSGNKTPSPWALTRIAEDIATAEYREVPEAVQQVVAIQVKEKFGTLRFYYEGGDDVVAGMVRMAESMSEVTCEECGNSGTQEGAGWIRTTCQEHKKKK